MIGQSHLSVAERVELVRLHRGDPSQTAFAARLKVSLGRLNNVLRGSPLGKDLAHKIAHSVPGLTVTWLWEGDTRGMPVDLVDALADAEATLKSKTAS
jgi:hypothetical protein